MFYKEPTKNDLGFIRSVFPITRYEEIFPSSDTPLEKVEISINVLNAYHTFSISPYTKDELESDCYNPIHYSQFFFEHDESIKYSDYVNREECFLSFYQSVFNSYPVYLMFIDEPVPITNSGEFFNRVKRDIREISFHRYLIPNLGVMISGNFDLNHVVHASRPYYKKEEFEKIVKESNLNIIC